MKATSIKQIKFNRGQVSDLLSERMDMGLQNACGTVYDNIYINRYGQIQNAPSCTFAFDDFLSNVENSIPSPCRVLGMFDTGTNLVIVVTYDQTNNMICLFGPLKKDDPYYKGSTLNKASLGTWRGGLNENIKFLQFGYNVVLYGQGILPVLLNILPNQYDSVVGWDTPQLTVKEDYFDKAFDKIFVRGLNIGVPSDFTVPTSGEYIIPGQTGVTSSLLVKVQRNGAGGAFTQSLVGQVINSPANGGSLQVRSVEDSDTLWAYVLSPLSALSATATDIRIPWNVAQNRLPTLKPQYQYDSAEWIFGYENPFGTFEVPGQGGVYRYSYPDSAVYVNQRLIFGGNDYVGNLVCASRVGVINDFDPESATESDAFTAQIASKDFCRIVNFTVSNEELRIACTNGEYATALGNLTPSGILNGFSMRSEVGIATDSAICDCGGLTAYISHDKTAIYGTQFNLLRDRYQPISLSSQTSDIINQTKSMVYLTNRPNSETNCLVGLNNDGSMFIAEIEINAGLVALSKIKQRTYTLAMGLNPTYQITKIFSVGYALWGVLDQRNTVTPQEMVVRFNLNEMFDLPIWIRNYGVHQDTLTVHKTIGRFMDISKIRALYFNSTTNKYEIIKPVSKTDNDDNTTTINFANGITLTNIVVAGYINQSDWRSVEIGIGMATRELNKQIIKLEGVIEPMQITGQGRFAGLVLTPEQAKNFITLTRSKEVETMDVDNLSNTSYTENQDLVWRRAFDNPSREMHYGVSCVAPFLVKSITATIQYDETA